MMSNNNSERLSCSAEEIVAWYLKSQTNNNDGSPLLRNMTTVAAMPRASDEYQQARRASLESISQTNTSTEKKSLKRLIDGSLVDISYLSEGVSNHNLYSDDIKPFADTLLLVEDLSLTYAAGIKSGQSMTLKLQSSSVVVAPIPPSKYGVDRLNVVEPGNNMPYQKNKVDADQDQNASDEPPKKKNPFSSAKDRFQQEGGKLPQSSVQTKRSDSNNIKGQVSNQNKQGSENDGLPPELAHCDKILVEKIEADIIHHGQPVTFADIAGLEFAKECVIETICWPMTQPQLFQGLRSLPRGVLLFGPPGTGKTLIGKAIAHQSGATFFSISASSLMSKWIGEGEKTVRTLFAVAAYRQPSVVFIDEVDSLLCQRSTDENEASRRIKTEFMVQLDGASTNLDARVVIIGATNRPEELDEAVRRRFVKRLYIPLPDDLSRRELFKTLVKEVCHDLTSQDIEELTMKTDGYSGADIRNLCTEAAMGPIRQLAQRSRGNLNNITAEDVPPVTFSHFEMALETVTPTVSQADLKRYLEWNSLYGSFKRQR